ncbi:MAG: ArsR family transcriptional regulator [Euryarchaeota archaeon]|nr:ArsR family transcriptional regulator [Euryarchaeota archaeon]MDE1835645.1 ArsR family transcriptional regulator [Euryarchaeota archaeon]MDE1878993.1 ArsR family transcriptional regulator [Euryarchaeota archaeon]MDE2043733.1 ArsR family transcriptional regulator [Thermoplasmata archaeon]
MEKLLWYLLAGTRGGYNRLRILDALESRPANAHQLAVELHLDYRTVCHHLDLLLGNHVLVNPRVEAYGSVYFLNPWLEGHPELLERIRVHVVRERSGKVSDEILAKRQVG